MVFKYSLLCFEDNYLVRSLIYQIYSNENKYWWYKDVNKFRADITEYVYKNSSIFKHFWGDNIGMYIDSMRKGEQNVEMQILQATAVLINGNINVFDSQGKKYIIKSGFGNERELNIFANIGKGNIEFCSMIHMEDVVEGKISGLVDRYTEKQDRQMGRLVLICNKTEKKETIVHQLFWNNEKEMEIARIENELGKIEIKNMNGNRTKEIYWEQVSRITKRKVIIMNEGMINEEFKYMGKDKKEGNITLWVNGGFLSECSSVLAVVRNAEEIDHVNSEIEKPERRKFYEMQGKKQLCSKTIDKNRKESKGESYIYKKEFNSDNILKIKKMLGDGNCLVWSLLDQINKGKEELVTLQEVKDTRNRIANYIKDHREEFEPFLVEGLVDGGFDNFIEEVRKPGIYLGHEAMVAFGRMFNKSIEIYQEDEPVIRIENDNMDDDVLRVWYCEGGLVKLKTIMTV